MKIRCSKGNFKIIQTKINQDELLVLGFWSDIVKYFGSTRLFLVNQKESSFGIYVCKQECAELMSELIQTMGSKDLKDFTIDFAVRNSHNLPALKEG